MQLFLSYHTELLNYDITVTNMTYDANKGTVFIKFLCNMVVVTNDTHYDITLSVH